MNAAGIEDQNGSPGLGSASTSWLMDTTPPASKVSPLPQRGTSLTFGVSVSGTDGGSPPAGLASFDYLLEHKRWARGLYGPRFRPSNPTANFMGQSNTTYAFYSIGHDLAGNTEVKTPKIEASTYLPNLTPPVTSVDGTSGVQPRAR